MQVTRYQAVQRIESRTHRPYIADGCDQQGRVMPTRMRPAMDSQEGACGDDERPGRHVQPWERAERIAVGVTVLACVVIVASAVASKVM